MLLVTRTYRFRSALQMLSDPKVIFASVFCVRNSPSHKEDVIYPPKHSKKENLPEKSCIAVCRLGPALDRTVRCEGRLSVSSRF